MRLIISASSHVGEEICIGDGIENSRRSTGHPERLKYASHQFNNKVGRCSEFLTEVVFYAFLIDKTMKLMPIPGKSCVMDKSNYSGI